MSRVRQTGFMADVVYLHVGAPKTGSTYLQDRLYANRAELASHGVHYPVGLQNDMFRAALALTERSWPSQPESTEGEWESLASRVRRADGSAIVSHEIMSVAKPAHVARAMATFEGAEIHVVYAVRDIARQIPAGWQEGLKHGQRQSFRRFVDRVMKADRREPTLFFWRAQSLPDVLSRWTTGLPPERVHVVTVPQAGSGPGELWARYCRAFGVDPAWAPADTARSNESVGIEEAALLRKLNRRLRSTDLDAVQYAHIVRHLMVHQTLATREDKRRLTLPPRARAWAHQVAQEWIEWVEGSGVDVVGDIEDMRPVFPEGTWQNPDKPRPRQVTDAALDALVAIIEETARRPDPDRATVARLGRAARRLRSR